MRKPDKKSQIMKAAEKLFTGRRFHEIKMSDVATAARVGKGTIYQYFKDKNDLFFQVATSGFEELCDLLHRKVPEGEPFASQLLDVCVAISSFFQGRRQLLRLMQSEDARMLCCRGDMRARWTETRRKLAGAVAAVLRKGVAEGVVRPDVPPEALASFLLGMLRTRAHDLAEAPEETRRIEVVVDLFATGSCATRRPDGIDSSWCIGEGSAV